MAKTSDLKMAVSYLLNSTGNYDVETADHLIYGLDMTALEQAIRHQVQTVFAYKTDGKQNLSFNYRGAELFDQRAALLYTEQTRSGGDESVFAARSLELWILEDFRVEVAVCLRVEYGSGAYVTEYRTGKGSLMDSGMQIDANKLYANLETMCRSVRGTRQPVYEL